MKEIPENKEDVKKILLNQMSLIKQNSEHRKFDSCELVQMSHALVELIDCYVNLVD